jgi:ribosomal protein L37AE/L43A
MRHTSGAGKNQKRLKSKARQDFSPKTREHLAKAAGYRCSRYRCLQQSTCVSEKYGDIVSANHGIAAHIYAAAKNGPRPAPSDMTPEKIEHVSNGIWACRNCGAEIDIMESKFSAESLQEMKRVRETAQEMAVCDPDIKRMAVVISPLEFDQVFWDHLPDLDLKTIRRELLRIGGEKILRYCDEAVAHLPTPPAQIALKPMASAIKAATDLVADDQSTEDAVGLLTPGRKHLDVEAGRARELRKAVTIADEWIRVLKQRGWNGVVGHAHYCYVKLAARDPGTGAISEAFIWTRGRGYIHYDRTGQDKVLRLRVNFTNSRVSNLDWQLKIDVKNGECQTSSTLRLLGALAPSDIDNPVVWEKFEAYEQVVQKLAQGWQPVGYVCREPGETFDTNNVHPEALQITSNISEAGFDECMYRCKKIRLAESIASKLGGWNFLFTQDYFEPALDENMICKAVDELRTGLRRSGSPIEVTVGRRKFRLLGRGGYVFFEGSWA